MNGLEVCRRIKEDERFKEIPVIFISAASDMEDKIRAFQDQSNRA
jgi:CheY-like chemotaxis protein